MRCKCSNCDSEQTLMIHRVLDGASFHGIWCFDCEIMNADDTILHGMTADQFNQIRNIDTSIVHLSDIFCLSCVNIGVESFVDDIWRETCKEQTPDMEIVYRRPGEIYCLYCLFAD